MCPNRWGGMMQPARAAHGAFLARRKLASGSSRAPCAFPNLRCDPRCWLFSCLGLWSHPPYFPKEHQKERCGHSRSQRSFITFYSALRNILLSAGFPAIFHMIALEQTFAALCKKFLLLLFLNRFDSIRNLFIIFALDFPALKNPILEKTNCCIQPSSHSSHASSSSSNQSGLSS